MLCNCAHSEISATAKLRVRCHQVSRASLHQTRLERYHLVHPQHADIDTCSCMLQSRWRREKEMKHLFSRWLFHRHAACWENHCESALLYRGSASMHGGGVMEKKLSDGGLVLRWRWKGGEATSVSLKAQFSNWLQRAERERRDRRKDAPRDASSDGRAASVFIWIKVT